MVLHLMIRTPPSSKQLQTDLDSPSNAPSTIKSTLSEKQCHPTARETQSTIFLSELATSPHTWTPSRPIQRRQHNRPRPTPSAASPSICAVASRSWESAVSIRFSRRSRVGGQHVLGRFRVLLCSFGCPLVLGRFGGRMKKVAGLRRRLRRWRGYESVWFCCLSWGRLWWWWWGWKVWSWIVGLVGYF